MQDDQLAIAEHWSGTVLSNGYSKQGANSFSSNSLADLASFWFQNDEFLALRQAPKVELQHTAGSRA